VGVFGVVRVEFHHFPGDAPCGLRLKHDPGGLQVILCRGVLKAGRNENFYNCRCYLFAFSPASVVLSANRGYSLLEPGKGLFVRAVENAAVQCFVIVGGCSFDYADLARVLSKVDSCMVENSPSDFKEVLEGDFFVVIVGLVNSELQLRPGNHDLAFRFLSYFGIGFLGRGSLSAAL